MLYKCTVSKCLVVSTPDPTSWLSIQTLMGSLRIRFSLTAAPRPLIPKVCLPHAVYYRQFTETPLLQQYNMSLPQQRI